MKTQSNPLTKLPNIGKVLAEMLAQVDIKTESDLKTAGSENAFIRLKALDKTACYCKLCALEGAIQGIRWHDLDEKKKMELKEFFEFISKKKDVKSCEK